MKTIKILSDTHWPVELMIDYWPGGLRINSWLKNNKNVAILEIVNWRPHFYTMVLCKGTDLLKAGYFASPYFPLLTTATVKFSGFWYGVRRTKTKLRNWCDSVFERVGL